MAGHLYSMSKCGGTGRIDFSLRRCLRRAISERFCAGPSGPCGRDRRRPAGCADEGPASAIFPHFPKFFLNFNFKMQFMRRWCEIYFDGRFHQRRSGTGVARLIRIDPGGQQSGNSRRHLPLAPDLRIQVKFRNIFFKEK